jgi:type I restriction-modification system DNA methylase subunit
LSEGKENKKTMYNLTKNNYHLKPKNSTIYTPPEVSQFIFELLKDKILKDKLILDPCSGRGSLLAP